MSGWRGFRRRGDPLERLSPAPGLRRGRPYDAVLMFRVLVLQTLYTLSNDQTECQLRGRLSFMRFIGLSRANPP